MGKGSARRPGVGYEEGWDRIFGDSTPRCGCGERVYDCICPTDDALLDSLTLDARLRSVTVVESERHLHTADCGCRVCLGLAWEPGIQRYRDQHAQRDGEPADAEVPSPDPGAGGSPAHQSADE